MTAEIAIMNKSAVALAADSAATVERRSGTKIYHGENKLFALSKYRPVGLMIFNNTDLCGVPLETIIKVYRHKLEERKFETIDEYAADFLQFLNGNTDLFPISQQDDIAQRIIARVFFYIEKQYTDAVKSKKKSETSSGIFLKIVNDYHKECKSADLLEGFNKEFEDKFGKKHKTRINELAELIFERKRFPGGVRGKLEEISVFSFSRKKFTAVYSGIVVVGFGDEEIMPHLRSYYIEAIVENRLKYHEHKKVDITYENKSSIEPFANDEAIKTIINGLNPKFEGEFISGALTMVFKLSRKVLDDVAELTKAQRNKYYNSSLTPVSEAWRNYLSDMNKYRKREFEDPVLDAISVLPKDELASVAESLVSVTSFRQRISLDEETVGGPIDVAIISKGDGFIWIKRKHYFEPEFNPHFVENYFRHD